MNREEKIFMLAVVCINALLLAGIVLRTGAAIAELSPSLNLMFANNLLVSIPLSILGIGSTLALLSGLSYAVVDSDTGKNVLTSLLNINSLSRDSSLEGINILRAQGHLSFKNLWLLINGQRLENNYGINKAIQIVNENAPELINERNIALLLQAHSKASTLYFDHYQKYLGTIFVFLNQSIPRLSQYENLQILVQADREVMINLYTLTLLISPRWMTQEIFNTLTNQENNRALSSLARALIELQATQENLITQPVFNELLTLREDALTHAREIIRLTAPIQGFADYVLPIQDTQSTHIASIHDSSSQSAIRLTASYGASLQPQERRETLAAIQAWANTQSQYRSQVNECLSLFSSSSYRNFKDPVSQISPEELMVLVWHAIHDEEKREGTLASAQQQFLEAFPEIYRSGSPICPGGAINKLIEKIVSIHPDAEQILVTMKQASAKLPIIVREETHAALIKYAPRTSAEVLKLTYFLEKLKQDGVELIWKGIEKQVSSRILDEFGTIFKSTTLFTNFLQDGLWTDLKGLKPLRRELTKAAGHNLSFDYLIRSSTLFFKSEDKKLKQHHVEAETQQEQIMETSPKL